MIFNTNTKQISFVIVFLFAFINFCLANENIEIVKDIVNIIDTLNNFMLFISNQCAR